MASVCSRCGTTETDGPEDVLPSGWSMASSARGIQWLCDRCTREHVRDIEAKLDEEWWG